MEINESSMFNSLKPLMQPEEKILCPVFANIQKDVKRMTHSTSEFAYITVTSKGRLVLYRFDSSVSHSEAYLLSNVMFGETQKMKNTGVYSAEISFLSDAGIQEDINFAVEPKPKGRAEHFPNQAKYADKMFAIFDKLLP